LKSRESLHIKKNLLIKTDAAALNIAGNILIRGKGQGGRIKEIVEGIS
jgi:hypothetical protein